MWTRIRDVFCLRLLFFSGYMIQVWYTEDLFCFRLYPYISIHLWTVLFSSNPHL